MLDRKRFVCTVWLTSAMALLTSALVTPVGASGLVADSSVQDGVLLDFALPSSLPTTLIGPARYSNPFLQVNPVPYDNEEEDRADALDEPRVSFLIHGAFHKIPDRQSISRGSIRSFYPLRC